MTHWIASTNRENWDVVKREHVWGVPERNRNTMQHVAPGDTILFFVAQKKIDDTILPSAVTGAYEVASVPFADRSRLFITPERMGGELFPYRVRVTPDLRQAMREIPEGDYRLILKRAGAQ